MNNYNKNDILFTKLLIIIAKADEHFERIEIDIINKFIKDNNINETDFKLLPYLKVEKIIDEIEGRYLEKNKNIVLALISSDHNLNINEGKILNLYNTKIIS